MCGRFRTAIGVCGVLLAAPLHVGCREQGRSEQGTPSEPAGEQETRSPAPIQSTPFTEPTWLPEEPAWWTDLSVDGREEISRADGRVDQAYGLWREGKLTKAMQEIEAALKAYQKLLGRNSKVLTNGSSPSLACRTCWPFRAVWTRYPSARTGN
jgi:hypothetical protein